MSRRPLYDIVLLPQLAKLEGSLCQPEQGAEIIALNSLVKHDILFAWPEAVSVEQIRQFVGHQSCVGL